MDDDSKKKELENEKNDDWKKSLFIRRGSFWSKGCFSG